MRHSGSLIFDIRLLSGRISRGNTPNPDRPEIESLTRAGKGGVPITCKIGAEIPPPALLSPRICAPLRKILGSGVMGTADSSWQLQFFDLLIVAEVLSASGL